MHFFIMTKVHNKVVKSLQNVCILYKIILTRCKNKKHSNKNSQKEIFQRGDLFCANMMIKSSCFTTKTVPAIKYQ